MTKKGNKETYKRQSGSQHNGPHRTADTHDDESSTGTDDQEDGPYEHELGEQQAKEHGQEVPYNQEKAKKFKPLEENENKIAKIRKQGESLK